ELPSGSNAIAMWQTGVSIGSIRNFVPAFFNSAIAESQFSTSSATSTAVRGRFPIPGEVRDCQRPGPNVVFDPAFLLITKDPALLQPQCPLVELLRPFQVSNWICGKGNFNDFHKCFRFDSLDYTSFHDEVPPKTRDHNPENIS